MNITGAERAILIDLLHNGDNVPKAISDNVGYSREHVQRCLGNLSEKELTSKKNDYGVWTLTENGTEKAEELEDRGFTKP